MPDRVLDKERTEGLGQLEQLKGPLGIVAPVHFQDQIDVLSHRLS